MWKGFFCIDITEELKEKYKSSQLFFYFLDLHKVFINIMLQYDLLSKSRLCFK